MWRIWKVFFSSIISWEFFFLRVFLLDTMIAFVQIKEACGPVWVDGEAVDVPPHQLCPRILPIWKNTSRYDILTWQAFIKAVSILWYFQICFSFLVTLGSWLETWDQLRVLVWHQTWETFTLITFLFSQVSLSWQLGLMSFRAYSFLTLNLSLFPAPVLEQ